MYPWQDEAVVNNDQLIIPYSDDPFFNDDKQHRVLAPAYPLIPDDDGPAHAFSQYISRQQPSPSVSSAATTTTISSFESAYSELYPFTFSFPTQTAAPIIAAPVPPPVPTPAPVPVAAPAPVDDNKPDSKRPSGACTRCKRMKMRCVFPPSETTCQRCKSSSTPCTVEGRKPRTPSARETLLADLRKKDALIASLLTAHRAPPPPITLAASKLVLPPALRAAQRDVLAAAEKAAPAPLTGSWRQRNRPQSNREKEKERNDDDDDAADDWSSTASDVDPADDPWDTDAAKAAGAVQTVYAHALPEPAAPLGLIARLSLADSAPAKRTAEVMEDERAETEEWGIANRTFFHPGPGANLALRRVLNERERPPVVLSTGLISWSEAERLFDLFYEYINPYVSLLDPVLHTPTSVAARCPFLFTVVCAIALRFETPRPGLHTIAMHLAKAAAATALIDGPKTIELVQGYFLLSLYGLPARRWEEDRSWFYGGLATRIAVDLGLNKPAAANARPLSERHARELRNRVRTWLICFNLDRSSATQFGKPSGVHDEELVGMARKWYRGPYSHPYDLHLVMYVELLRIMSRFHAQVYVDGVLNKKCNFRAVTQATEAELDAWHDDATWRYEHESDPHGTPTTECKHNAFWVTLQRTDPGSVLRTQGVPFFENYMRLVMYSFGFQDAWRRRGVEPGDMFFVKCLQAASKVLRHVVDVLAPCGYLRFAPDCQFVMAGFCAAFLLKMLRPEYAALLDATQRERVLGLVGEVVAALASPKVALDEVHTPMLYARFLRGQLELVGSGSTFGPGSTVRASESVKSGGSVKSDGPRTPGSIESSCESSLPTPSPVEDADGDAWMDGGSVAAGVGVLGEEEYLATMQAVVSEGWLGSVLMPGFKWDGGEGIMESD